jgi:hypothetical protein
MLLPELLKQAHPKMKVGEQWGFGAWQNEGGSLWTTAVRNVDSAYAFDRFNPFQNSHETSRPNCSRCRSAGSFTPRSPAARSTGRCRCGRRCCARCSRRTS